MCVCVCVGGGGGGGGGGRGDSFQIFFYLPFQKGPTVWCAELQISQKSYFLVKKAEKAIKYIKVCNKYAQSKDPNRPTNPCSLITACRF